MPKDVEVYHYECEDRCSNKFDALYAESWYTHVVPQLRKESWYGQKIIETIQGPGEIIYIPHGQGHSVLNLDENLSITENFLGIAALDELAQYHAYDWNPFQFGVKSAAKRIWTNLMNRDLKDRKVKSYAKEMLKQVRLVKPHAHEEL